MSRENDNPRDWPLCEECDTPTLEVCSRCARRICRKCMGDHPDSLDFNSAKPCVSKTLGWA